VGDLVEYVDEAGVIHTYKVQQVVHTLQAAPEERPKVGDSHAGPASLPHPNEGPQLVPESGELRAGLPRVILVPSEADEAG
jgi:hypothetical protein